MPLNDRDIITIIKTNKTMMNLEKLGLSSGDLLQRSQLAKILGGDDSSSFDSSGSCSITCSWWNHSMAVNDCTLSTRGFIAQMTRTPLVIV